jgi:hypothetical protein
MAWSFFLNNTEVEEPIGWDAIAFRAQRMEFSGIDQVFSTDVQFYGEGARFLKDVYDEFFINGYVKFRITSDQFVNGQPYEFIGQVNFALYEETNVCDTDSWVVSVGIIEDNFRERFKARMGTDINLFSTTDLDGSPIPALTLASGLTRVRLHSQNFILSGSAKQLAETSLGVGDYHSRVAHVCPYYWGSSDYKDNYGSSIDVDGFNFTNTNVNFQNNAGYTRSFQLTGNLKFKLKNDGVYSPPTSFDNTIIRMFGDVLIRDASHNQVSFVFIGLTNDLHVLNNPDDEPTEGTFSWPFDTSVTLEPGWSFQIRMFLDADVTAGYQSKGTMSYLWPDETFFKLTEVNAGEQYASPCDGLLVFDCLKRLIYQMTGDPDGLISQTFNPIGQGCYFNNFLTTGMQVRNGADPNGGIQPEMTTSFDDLFKSLYGVFCLGWSYEKTGLGWKIRVEKLDYFFKNQVALEPTNIGEVTQRAMSDRLVNQIKVGFDDKWKNIAISGIYSIHTTRTYSIANKATRDGTTADLDLISDFIAEGNTIEFLRRLSFLNNEDNPGSSDRPNDYDFFLIWLNRFEVSIENLVNSGYGFKDETGSAIFDSATISANSNQIAFSSSLADRLYNIYHTPTRIAYRHWKSTGMHTYGLLVPVMRFQTGEYFTEYSSRITETSEDIDCIEVVTDVNLSEQSNIEVGMMQDWAKPYLFKPIEIEFEYPQSFCDFINLSTNNQFDKVRASSGRWSQSGWIQSIENKPTDAKGGTTIFRLIASNIADPQPPPEGRAYSDAYSSAYS